MTIDWSKPVQTRDGRPVEIITRHGRGKWPVVGYMDKDNYPSTWTACGMYHPGEIHVTRSDLINVPERAVYWASVYYRDDGRRYPSLEEAIQYAAHDPAGFVKIVFEGKRLISAEVVEVDQ